MVLGSRPKSLQVSTGNGFPLLAAELGLAGVPCVGTSIAYEGFTLPPALTGCVADTPEGIASALVRLYRDAAAHAIAAQAGQRYVLVSCGEAHVDALMQQALAPSLRSWAGIAQEPSGGAPSMQMAG